MDRPAPPALAGASRSGRRLLTATGEAPLARACLHTSLLPLQHMRLSAHCSDGRSGTAVLLLLLPQHSIASACLRHHLHRGHHHMHALCLVTCAAAEVERACNCISDQIAVPAQGACTGLQGPCRGLQPGAAVSVRDAAAERLLYGCNCMAPFPRRHRHR